MIKTITTETTVTTTRTCKFPIWIVNKGDTQAVRYDKSKKSFLHTFDYTDEEIQWSAMGWDEPGTWLEDVDKRFAIETLTHLLKLIKATK